MKHYLILLLKGFGMGAANVIPGVSGGTIALVTGIYEQLINSLKSFNLRAVKLLFSGNFKNFIEHTQLKFLVSVFLACSTAETITAPYPFGDSFLFGMIFLDLVF